MFFLAARRLAHILNDILQELPSDPVGQRVLSCLFNIVRGDCVMAMKGGKSLVVFSMMMSPRWPSNLHHAVGCNVERCVSPP
jgi:hypothetical protein